MTFQELCDWVKATKDLESQVVIAVQEDEEADETLEEVGGICFLPFIAASHKATTIKNTFLKASSRLYVELWDDDVNKTVDTPYTWGNLVNWIENLPDPNIEATALVAWHLCNLKFINNEILYAYQE